MELRCVGHRDEGGHVCFVNPATALAFVLALPRPVSNRQTTCCFCPCWCLCTSVLVFRSAPLAVALKWS
eukprot:15438516-Alexandrium_andersonii.AAC.1